MYGSKDLYADSAEDKNSMWMSTDITYFDNTQTLMSKIIGDNYVYSVSGEAQGLEYSYSFDYRKAKIDTVTLNDKKHIRVKNTVSINFAGMEFETDILQLIYVKKGIAFVYQFDGDETDENYSDFLSLVKSADYSQIKTQKENQYTTLIIVGVVCCLAMVAVIVFFISRKSKRTTAISCTPEAMTVGESSELEKAEVEKLDPTCPSCGRQVPEGSKFCQYCGKKL
jgi:hypothetical protein